VFVGDFSRGSPTKSIFIRSLKKNKDKEEHLFTQALGLKKVFVGFWFCWFWFFLLLVFLLLVFFFL
jgi:hypothetical protein